MKLFVHPVLGAHRGEAAMQLRTRSSVTWPAQSFAWSVFVERLRTATKSDVITTVRQLKIEIVRLTAQGDPASNLCVVMIASKRPGQFQVNSNCLASRYMCQVPGPARHRAIWTALNGPTARGNENGALTRP